MGYIQDLREVVGKRPLILVGSVAIILNKNKEVLLQHRKFPKNSWGLPGGLMELGESTEEVARREVFEETGLKINKLNLINVYSGKQNHLKAENGDEFFVVTVAYYTEEFEGELIIDEAESINFEFFSFDEIPKEIVDNHKKVIEDFLTITTLN
ncbi:NUDIX hydrolase [Planococcus halotolerans]|uniref:DNA mismatch repair protein MutT n=1 Tax=Planococcus halotolerans TaxID=2233542 RepID=A0A365KK00_9BACL|nr:NUDIX hydrolase [Planococcus halotolerans]RAZ73470.1 DNA mismatch repair protein MutT [Planococcus halotolerans]